ncbi:helix-turn-helix domain-containing protein [Paenibacillus sp. sptzw28]|uniref:helix-turn-helix domain-containing protein n=1 Tax=Paenibacillus sp. sptzw28 TaxID=715179 RepID=UPI001C6E7207|nr:helix-turn-helix domain-containing protein [Paenibacillus sp. sptzw28]QYR19659.1 helix-turn-helix domain-containing protein [Paenibacillus sp. sptzw28]
MSVTHEALAVELGTAREVVSRTLAKFKRSGLIDTKRGKISIVRREKMKELHQTECEVYVKGIMHARDSTVFVVLGSLTRAEAAAVVVRMLDKDQPAYSSDRRQSISK